MCFFYAKRTPLSDDSRRVIVGVGRVVGVGDSVEYRRKTKGADGLRCMLWERNIEHSIRDDFSDGFVFPYQEILARAAADESINPAELVAYAPDEHWDEFSYATAHVTHDGAISSLLACAGALRAIGEHIPGAWDTAVKWIDRELNRLWQMRGPYPGLGSALTAFGIENGNLVAYDIAMRQEQEGTQWNEDPWPTFERALKDPSILSPGIAVELGENYAKVWTRLADERRALLKLLSRFSISAAQATRYYQETERQKSGITARDADLITNPYLIYELDRGQLDAIDLGTIDRGMFPDPVVREKHPLPRPSALADAVDPRRVRAFVVEALERAAEEGHTLQPRDWIIQAVRDREVSPPVPLSVDLLAVAEEHFDPLVHAVKMADGAPAFQLHRLVEAGGLIRSQIEARLKGKRHATSQPWRKLIDGELDRNKDKAPRKDDKTEERARSEKAAALEQLYSGRVSVLVGPAGTGKTTLLCTLCNIPDVDQRGVLLLAPTGKAAVKMAQSTKRKASTLAQFLVPSGRYEPATGRYLKTGADDKCDDYKTVIIDESSMLTEEQLAATLDALKGIERLVLVGDPRQLPPIGSGRPFVDIVRRLAPPNVDVLFPRCAANYAELTVTCRQGGGERDDLLLAQWFSGRAPDPGADEIWDRLGQSGEFLRLVPWETSEELERKLLAELKVELKQLVEAREPGNGYDDSTVFEVSLGGGEFKGAVYYRIGAAEHVESWQILSPVRPMLHGVDSLNRTIQSRFRERARAWATPEKFWMRRTPVPFGRQGLLYGDKVMSVVNKTRRDVYPKSDDNYIANGDIGIAVGQYKGAGKEGKPPWKLEVEFATHRDRKYGYFESEFSSDERTPPLELAYALTIHKAQGSEFGVTFVVLPNPCWLLSRELLYTALTRQRDRVIVFHQGGLRDLRRYGSDEESVIARRMSNLFEASLPVKVKSKFYDDKHIHRTDRGDLVISKSEVIIANMLFTKLGIKDYEYEKDLIAPDGSRRVPDFTIEDAASGATVYLEHLGMLHDPVYRKRWNSKLQWYAAMGIKPVEDGGGEQGVLVTTADGPDGSIDCPRIEKQLREVLGL